uniref:Replication protein n=1 Tax=uncultured prokaryote TaxID=198431 RepID=A0A0H5Q3P3_9ZZZZ|nr:hypothetical protein [uncultured prokaryote]
MKTSKPFSTISYNSADYLNQKLSELVSRRKIDFFAWVFHYPEEDEKKEHKHLYIVPNGQVDTDQVLDYLLEIDPTKPDKPLGCIRPHSSKFADWYLYAIHDTAYLASKGQARKYHYTQSDVQTCDNDYLLEEIHTIDFAKLGRFNALRDAAVSGLPFQELLMSGVVPIQQTYAYREAYGLMSAYATNRAGNEGHEEINPDTGEIIMTNEKTPKK